ncbi:MAG: pyridoxamine 5'-phosphate oxidase family protein [Chitinophagaceae bacterium]|nr:MAG: pyridoxamine 5'-phosphate oxidase family protein [Chitinophagaceae bacterium]
MIGILTEEEIEAVLGAGLIGRIGCHHDGTTYVVPISYAYSDGSVYALTGEGLKLSIMRQNPEVCFEVESQKNMANWQTVIAWGTFRELTDPGERLKGLEKLTARILPMDSSQTTHLYADWPFPPDDINMIKGIVFQIRLHKKSGRFEKREFHLSSAL